jgi:SAM-dependent methyltransferase
MIILMAKSVWDGIYKDFKEGGEAYATLSGEMEPSFFKLIETTSFASKHALDIGFGTGRYMDYLRQHGFEVDGIDNSPTAFELASKNLGTPKGLEVADMYESKIKPDTYDLIYSISTIHHGPKDKVNKLLGRVHEALLPGGYFYGTIPINSSANGWMNFKDKTEVAPGTWSPNSGPEKGLPHSFYTKDEIQELFGKYSSALIAEDGHGRWIIIAKK